MPDAIDILVDQHARLRELADHLRDGVTAVDAERRLSELIVEAGVHSSVELRDFYPALAPVSEIGAAELQHAVAGRMVEHRRIREALDALADHTAAGPPSHELVHSLQAAIEGHIAAEEKDLVPLVRRFISDDRLEEIGQALVDAMDASTIALQDDALARARKDVAAELRGSVQTRATTAQ